MTAKQEKQLNSIESKLLDVFIDESDPDKWDQVKATDPPKEQAASRGNRYWQAKVANQTMALLTRIVTYRTKLTEVKGGGLDLDDEKEMKKDMKAAEKKVHARLSLVKKRAC